MKSSARADRRKTLSSRLGLGDRVFASAEDRTIAAAIGDGLELVESALLREVAFADSIANVTSRYLLNAGGKRVRPTLTLLTAQLGNGNSEDVITASAAIEITHLASLYHDDVMDEADQRRGVPSTHKVWGNSVAILAGDLLFARASQLMAELGERAIRLQAGTFERLVLGQLHETTGPRSGEDPIEHYLTVLADKTGSLIAAAAQLGIIFSGANRDFEAPVVEFGERIGIAFQLVDDVIDLSPQPEETGKTPGTDLRAGVATLPLLKLRELAQTDVAAAALLARLERVIEVAEVTTVADPAEDRRRKGSAGPLGRSSSIPGHGDEPNPADASQAIEDLRNHDVTRQTVAEAERWAAEAVAALVPLPSGSVKKALTRFAETVVDRSN